MVTVPSRRRVDEMLDRRVELAEGEDPADHAGEKDEAVDAAGGDRDDRSARAIAADDEAHTEHQAADDLGQQVGRIDEDQRQIHHPAHER